MTLRSRHPLALGFSLLAALMLGLAACGGASTQDGRSFGTGDDGSFGTGDDGNFGTDPMETTSGY
jgi:hypothetical protein